MRNRHPVIGVVPYFDDDGSVIKAPYVSKQIFLRRDYLDMLARAGAVPLIISPELDTEIIMSMCDGIVIAGGRDIEPDFYGEEKLPAVIENEPRERFEWEKELIEAAQNANVPLLGICYGMQRLNVHFGGSLIQDIPTEVGGSVDHDIAEHNVNFLQSFLGFEAGETKNIFSRHHQALARIADNFTVAAEAPDGIPEAIVGENMWGIQWHPESDITGVHVYRFFVEKCMVK